MDVLDTHSHFQDLTQVLIVDDDESMRALLRAALTQWGYQVIEASDGAEAWEIVQKPNPPSLLIMDWLMPKVDGIELCQRIRKQSNYFPYIIFLSQVSGYANIVKGLEAGADEFLFKPVNFSDLHTRLFAGERIIKCLAEIAQQKECLQECLLYIDLLQQMVIKNGEKK